MFYNRFISICLLLLYGAPAIVGPDWHQHGSSCSHPNAVSSAPTPLAAGAKQEPRQCLCDDADQVAVGFSQLPHEHDARTEAGDCLICNHYAQALLAVPPVNLSNQWFVSPIAPIAVPASSAGTIRVWDARGPPATA